MLLLATLTLSYRPPPPLARTGEPSQLRAAHGRRQFLQGFGAAVLAGSARPAVAADKLRNLPADKLAAIVRSDLVDRQFLATADFTREIYDEAALFTDEIDTCKHFPADRTSVPRDTERPPFPPRWLPQIRCPNSSRAPQRW